MFNGKSALPLQQPREQPYLNVLSTFAENSAGTSVSCLTVLMKLLQMPTHDSQIAYLDLS